jgi:hypothetical protein
MDRRNILPKNIPDSATETPCASDSSKRRRAEGRLRGEVFLGGGSTIYRGALKKSAIFRCPTQTRRPVLNWRGIRFPPPRLFRWWGRKTCLCGTQPWHLRTPRNTPRPQALPCETRDSRLPPHTCARWQKGCENVRSLCAARVEHLGRCPVGSFRAFSRQIKNLSHQNIGGRIIDGGQPLSPFSPFRVEPLRVFCARGEKENS